jgi:erythromycin esterase-like protein
VRERFLSNLIKKHGFAAVYQEANSLDTRNVPIKYVSPIIQEINKLNPN